MKITAHPLMVAVAMGLLAPMALADDNHLEDLSTTDKPTCTDEDVLDALESDEGPVWAQLVLNAE